MQVRRGQVYFVALDPVEGHEAGGDKERPVVVLSINSINQKPLVVTIVPGTTAQPPGDFKNMVRVDPKRENGLRDATYFECHQVRAIDHTRFESTSVGQLSPSDLAEIESAVKFCLGL